mmetsp:Transcript_89707/g.192279  ORF Transcript_89707/g.192279 Transcript_89707/m.192279 type:complete len:1156 (+) Transcript_89707:172-3639(+)
MTASSMLQRPSGGGQPEAEEFGQFIAGHLTELRSVLTEEHNRRANAANERKCCLEKEIGLIQEQLVTLRSEADQLPAKRQEIATLKEENATLRAGAEQFSAMQQEIAALREENAALHARPEEPTSSMTTLREQNDALRAKIELLSATQELEIATLREELVKVSASSKLISGSADGKDAHVSQVLEAEIAMLREQNSMFRAGADEALAVQKELATFKDENAALRSEVAQISTAQKEVANLREENAKLSAKVEEVTAEAAALSKVAAADVVKPLAAGGTSRSSEASAEVSSRDVEGRCAPGEGERGRGTAHTFQCDHTPSDEVGGAVVSSGSNMLRKELSMRPLVDGAALWRASCSPDADPESCNLAGLGLRLAPSEDEPICNWIPSGKVIMARSTSLPRWMEVILDGCSRMYMLKEDPNMKPDIVLVRVDPILEGVDADDIYAFPMTGPAVAATKAIYDDDPEELPSQEPSSKTTISVDSDAVWWRVVHSPRVAVRTAPSPQASYVNAVKYGTLVLGKKLPTKPWIEVIDDGHPGEQGYFMLVDGSSLPETGVGVLLKRETSAQAVLGANRLPMLSPLLETIFDTATVTHIIKTRLPILGYPNSDMVKLEEISGKSSKQKTYKFGIVANTKAMKADAMPDHWAIMHCWREIPKLGLQGVVWKARYMSAHRLFGNSGLGPALQLEGPGWFIEAYCGVDLRKTEQIGGPCGLATELGRLLAHVHQQTTGWFSEWRNLLGELYPWARSLDRSSHVWWHACDINAFAGIAKKDLLEWANTDCFHPVTQAAKRVVTMHGDFRLANIVRGPANRLVCIDSEHACVGMAVEDLGVAIGNLTTLNERQAFAQGYLHAFEYETDEQSVADLIFDTQVYRFCSKWLRWLKTPKTEASSNLAADITDLQNVVKSARLQTTPEAAELRRALTSRGLRHTLNLWRKQQGQGPSSPEKLPRPVEGTNQVMLRADLSAFGAPALQKMDSFARSNPDTVLPVVPAVQPPLPYTVAPAAGGPNSELEYLANHLSLGLLEKEFGKRWASWNDFLQDFEKGSRKRSKAWEAGLHAALKMRAVEATTEMSAHDNLWLVVGAHETASGVVVRRGWERGAPKYTTALTVGTIVEQLGLQNNRLLHYRRLRGEGPDYGWVDIRAAGVELLMPFFSEIDD